MAFPVAGIQALMGAVGGDGGGAAGGIKSLTSAIGGLGGATSSAQGAIKGFGDGILSALMGPLGTIQSIAGSIGQLVGLANPAVMEQFTLAMNNAMATIGTILTPIMQALTVVTQAWGSAMAALQPVIQPLFDQIAGVISGMAEGIKPLMEALAPIIQLVVQGLNQLISVWAQFEGFLVGFITELIGQVTALLGLQSDFNNNAQQTNAVRNIGVSGVKDFASSQFAQQVKMAFGTQSEGEKNREIQQKIAAAMEEGRQTMKELIGAIKTLTGVINTIDKATDKKNIKAGIANGVIGFGMGDAMLSVL